MKHIIKGTIKILLLWIVKRIPLGNYIVFESYPDFSDNSKNVYDEMINRGLSHDYKMIWLYKNKSTKHQYNNTKFVRFDSFGSFYYRIRAKAIICCNRFVEPFTDKQFSIFLGHGTAIKNIGKYLIPQTIKYSLAASPNTAQMRANEFKISENKVIPLGFPRNDDLTNKPIDLHRFFKNEYNRIVIWYPTFRQHTSGSKTGSSCTIPLLQNKDNIISINKVCSDLKILLVIKPHFAQNISFIKKMDTSNIIFIDDTFFIKNEISSYAFLGNCDALLTDYSSVYFDFSLCDKPIGLVWEDYDMYKKNPGFAIDMDYAMKGGYKIYTAKDLIAFFTLLCKGEDTLKKERREIRDCFNISTDGKNTNRVVDFIIDKMPR